MNLPLRAIALIALSTGGLTSCAFDEDFMDAPGPQPTVVYVKEPRRPVYYDPYYNRPKVYRDPVYYESTNKKTKGSKVYKTTTIRNEYGQTVYKETTSKKKKKH